MKQRKKCHNCHGTGIVNGIRKRERGIKEEKITGKCYYCKGEGYR